MQSCGAVLCSLVPVPMAADPASILPADGAAQYAEIPATHSPHGQAHFPAIRTSPVPCRHCHSNCQGSAAASSPPGQAPSCGTSDCCSTRPSPSSDQTQLLCSADYAPAIAMDPRPPAARLAEHAFLQYQRLLQREVSEPELVIQLPNVLGDYGTMLSESADVAGVEFMELKVIIAFEALRPRCGMHFCGDWALSDNEVGSAGKQCKSWTAACAGVGCLHAAALGSS